MPDFSNLAQLVYSLETDFVNSTSINATQLKDELNADVAISASRTCVGVTHTDGEDGVIVSFDDSVTNPTQTNVITTIVNAYVYETFKDAPMNNYVATRPPLATDDDTKGYGAGSLWLYNGRYWLIEPGNLATGNTTWTALNTRYQMTIVDRAGTGDYKFLGEALAAGKRSIFVKDGTYAETQSLDFGADKAQIIGESLGGVRIIPTSGNTLTADATGGACKKDGTISIAHGTSTVVGVGTTFTVNLVVGDQILLKHGYFEIASIESDTGLTLTDTYQGSSLSGEVYRAHAMFMGVRIHNIIIVGSSSKGVFFRGCRNSTISSCAFKANGANVHLQHCGHVSVSSGVSESSGGHGLCIDECTSVLVTGMGFSGSVTAGMNIANGSHDVTINGCTCTSNKTHGTEVEDTCMSVKVNDTELSNNQLDGLFASVTTSYIVCMNCNASNNGRVGIDSTGSGSSMTGCIATYNGTNGVNMGSRGNLHGCTIEHNVDDGVDLVASDNCELVGNFINYNGGNGTTVNGNKNTLTSNQFLYNTGYAVSIESGSEDTSLAVNTATGNTAGSVLDNGTRTRYATTHSIMSSVPTATDDKFPVGHVVVVMAGAGGGSRYTCVSNDSAAAEWCGENAHAIAPVFDHMATGAVTYTVDAIVDVGRIVDDRVIVVNATSTAIVLSTPTAAEMVAQAGVGAVIGSSWTFVVTHAATSTKTASIVAGAGVVLVGTGVVSDTTTLVNGSGTAQFRVRLDNVTGASEAVTMYRSS